MEKSNIERRLLEWIARDDYGISSMTMAYAAVGLLDTLSDVHHPLDVGDLGRCVRLLDEIEEVRSGFDALKALSADWKNIIDNWDDLYSSYKAELERSPGSTRLPVTRAYLNSLSAQ